MSDLKTNLAKLQQKRVLNSERRNRTATSLAEFIDMRVKKNEPAPTPVAPAAVARRLAPSGPGQHSMNDGHGHGSAAEVKGLNKEFEQSLNALIRDSGGRIKVTSGYRSVERQTQLWNAALKKYGSAAAARKWVAPPGRSNHNHGLAADISGDKKWARQNAAKYGLHFPLANEDWHIEPISARKKK